MRCITKPIVADGMAGKGQLFSCYSSSTELKVESPAVFELKRISVLYSS